MKKSILKFKTKGGDLHLKESKILSIKQEKEGSDWYVIAYEFTDRYVHHYDVMILPDICDKEFLERWGICSQKENITPFPPRQHHYGRA